MNEKVTPQTTLEGLRKEAKRWLKAIRAGDAQAVERLARIYSGYKVIALRTVQHALALEYGFPSWSALKREFEERLLAARSQNERVKVFLEKSASRYGVAPGTRQWNNYEPDRPARGILASRLLARFPEIARDSIHTAVAAHDIDATRELLRKDPALASDAGGPDGWTPLLRLAYTRLPIDAISNNGLSIASALLDAGADPNASWSDGENNFTVLTGVIGGGECGQTAHPQAEAIARLLISRGADPFDPQALYNTSLGPDSTTWLEMLWSECEKRGTTERWLALNKGLGGPRGYRTVDYLLGNAVPRHPRRVEWLLQHGASAKAVNAYSRMPVIKHAMLAGASDVVDLLVRYGASQPQLSEAELFVSAVARADKEEVRRMAEQQPALLQNPHALVSAIQQSRPDMVELLIDLGVSPGASDFRGFTALHLAADSGAVEIAKVLIARGADVDAIERQYNSTPLGHAHFHGRTEMIEFLTPFSRDIRGLCFAAAVERLSELLEANRSLASAVTRGGEVPLFALPDDDERAVEVVELLLAYGADPTARNAAGLTPAEAAQKRGLEEAAAALQSD